MLASLVALGSVELGVSSVAVAAPPEGSMMEGPALPSVEDEPGEDPLPDVAPDEERPAPPDPDPDPEHGDAAEVTDATPAAIEPPAPKMEAAKVVRVAVGLSMELDGSKDEKALLDGLERSLGASPWPSADVRRLRVGSSEPKDVCREGRDDLVINIGYIPDSEGPVLLTRDCSIGQELGVRSAAAAGDPDLLGVLWAEHDDRVANGARERRRARVSPRVRTVLIASAAVAVIGLAVGLLIASAARRETVVLVVSP